MTKKYKVIIGALVIVLVSIIGISLGYFFLHKTGTNYKNITDLTKEYDATAEIIIAQKNLAESPNPAQIISKGKASKKVIALTIDCMGDKGTVEGLLDVLKNFYSSVYSFFKVQTFDFSFINKSGS